MITAPPLELRFESKIRDLMPRDQRTKRLEASGVLATAEHFLIVFDNRTDVARIARDLQLHGSNRFLGTDHAEQADEGYEGIAYNSVKQRFYLLIESRQQNSGEHKAEITEYDESFNSVKRRPLDYAFKSRNKGFEAVAHVHRAGQDYVLALCEGNSCQGGRKGRRPGSGRIQLFEKKKKHWAHRDTIPLPTWLPFVDYSAMAIDSDRVVIVSQVNSMLWIGQFDETEWAWRDTGQLYEFPRNDNGSIRYGNVEGVDWIADHRVVTVSDRWKRKKQPDQTLAKTDQSIQIFDIPL